MKCMNKKHSQPMCILTLYSLTDYVSTSEMCELDDEEMYAHTYKL